MIPISIPASACCDSSAFVSVSVSVYVCAFQAHGDSRKGTREGCFLNLLVSLPRFPHYPLVTLALVVHHAGGLPMRKITITITITITTKIALPIYC